MTDLPLITGHGIKILDHVKLPVWLFSLETLQIRVANEAAQGWLGYDLATVQSMTIVDLRPDSERDRIVEEVLHFDGLAAAVGTWTNAGKSGAVGGRANLKRLAADVILDNVALKDLLGRP